jgi:methylmalonyl-CoA/ethylmalonyl-CoA epimerase
MSPSKSDNPNIIAIKHLAFAVRDAKAARAAYARLLCVPENAPIHEYQKSRNRVAIFDLGGVEYQLCESMEPDGRFARWIRKHGGEGLHHICYAVDDIAHALRHAATNGARLRVCASCQVTGSHPHPEGYVAFLDDEAGGIEIEFMQVYTPEELERYQRVQGI